MKRALICLILLSLFIITGCKEKQSMRNAVYTDSNAVNYDANMKRDLLCLMMSYPEYICNIERSSDGNVFIMMKSGRKILYDDKRTKNFEHKLANPDLQDMMGQTYPLADISNLMEEDFDPGRIRKYALLSEVYGESREKIQGNLISVKVGYKKFLFNRNNKAAEALETVMKELIQLTQSRNDIYSAVFPTSGTFNYRLISGTNLLSAHSFGTAIDLAVDKRDYWKWASRESGEKRVASYPKEVVRIFEKNNFIWGGKWGHFDIMHFEYRPELILKSRYFSNKQNYDDCWYDGVPQNDDNIKQKIQLIDKL